MALVGIFSCWSGDQQRRKDISAQINLQSQDEGHYNAGGIFVYEDSSLGRKTEDLNQKNVEDALRTVPKVAVKGRTRIERR